MYKTDLVMLEFMMMAILLILLFVSVLIVVLNDFRPTRYFWIRFFRLYKFSKRYKNTYDFDEKELNLSMYLLIIEKCVGEKEIIEEVRNGYVLEFYPEDVDVNRRKMTMNYVDIFDEDIEVLVRIAFGENNKLIYQVEYAPANSSFQKMFIKSRQGSLADFDEQFTNNKNASKIVEKYVSYVMKNVL